MRTIPLSRGAVAFVDDEDYEFLIQHNWWLVVTNPRTQYAGRWGVSPTEPKFVYMHRLLMGFPPCKVDHKNRIGIDNQRLNLRLASHRQNMVNSAPAAGKSSALKGVHWEQYTQKWRAKIRHDGKVYSLGRFTEELDAARAYNEAAARLFGEFAWLNPIP